ncbi:MAG: UvrD-helicase domain-containing protein [Acidobacteriota bacterium]
MMSSTTEQRMAVEASGSVVVTAGAGTGKTQMLSERYLYHLTDHRLSPLEIVAVTFTDKAAAELRARIRQQVATHLPDRSELLAELEAGQISTIHALAIRVCREHPIAAAVPPTFSVLDESDGLLRVAEWFRKAIDALPAQVYDQIPYSLLQVVIKALLKDPIMAERALQCGTKHWPGLVAELQQQSLDRLLNNWQWRYACQTINSITGVEVDRIEQSRRLAAQAVMTLERGEAIKEALTMLNGLDLRGGSKKNWPPDGLEAIKDALKALREKASEALAEGLVMLKMGPVDDQLAALLPVLRDAYQQVRDFIAIAKREARMLDFADLEEHALRALSDPQVQQYYARRWKAFLVDEFQDTNGVQAEILERLSTDAILTIVGDEKQSIYGFRRADVEVFRRFRTRILSGGGREVQLSTSFRTHAELVTAINQISQAMLAELHQELAAHRKESPHYSPHVGLYLVRAEKESHKFQRQLIEAKKIATIVREMLDSSLPIYDKATGLMRAVRPGDIAILSRVWQPLKVYGDALAALNIPSVHAGGGSLLDTREAKDGWALLRFLAEPDDSLALAAVLRSPFFALSDRVLFTFAQSLTKRSYWWTGLQETSVPELARPRTVLGELLDTRRRESPSRLLQLADRLSGYSAIIANLAGAPRREADWRGFIDLIRTLERSSVDLSALVQRLRRLIEADVEIPRPPLEAGDAIALMTIHAAKGLEWPIVIVPDLTRAAMSNVSAVYFDPTLGVAAKVTDEDGEAQKPVLYTILWQKQRTREQQEARRMLYVALTRVRDRLILTAADEKGGALDLLLPGLTAAGVVPQFVEFDPADALPPTPAEPDLPAEPPGLLIGAVPTAS